jgi:hypothetical protein
MTVHLPEYLALQITAYKISPEDLERAVILMLEAYLKATTGTSGKFSADAKEFASRLIVENPDLFARLAKL